jgi:hypothetical protein
LYDDEVLTALCLSRGRDTEVRGLLQDKADALAASIARGNPSDHIKSAAGQIYISTKKRLGLTGVGNDPASFARNVLAPLVTPNVQTYKELRHCIFGAYSERWRSAFRGDGDHDSERMPITIPR